MTKFLIAERLDEDLFTPIVICRNLHEAINYIKNDTLHPLPPYQPKYEYFIFSIGSDYLKARYLDGKLLID